MPIAICFFIFFTFPLFIVFLVDQCLMVTYDPECQTCDPNTGDVSDMSNSAPCTGGQCNGNGACGKLFFVWDVFCCSIFYFFVFGFRKKKRTHLQMGKIGV